MKSYYKIEYILFMLLVLSTTGLAQKNNKEILEDYFSRPAINKTYDETNTEFPSIEVGQWLILRKYEGSKETPVLLKYSVVGKDDDKFWIEVKDIRKKKTIIAKFLISGIEGSSFANSKIIDGKAIQNGESTPIWSVFSMYLMPLQGIDKAKRQKADFTCVSGTYKNIRGHSGSFQNESAFENKTITFNLKTCDTGTMIYHPAVPFGLVGWNASKDKAEIIEFGFEGAVSEITE